MSNSQKSNYLWEYLYMIGLTIIIGLLSLMFYLVSLEAVLALFLCIIICVAIVFKRPLSRKLLYFNNLLLLGAPLCLAYIVTLILNGTKDSLIGLIAGVAVIDVFSFTKAGRNTLNAKLSGSTNTLARLSACLPVPSKPGLQPIIGAGDLTYYSLITMFSRKTNGFNAALTALLILLIGQLINILFIAILKKRQWTKGFPATLFPGLFAIFAVILNII